MLKFKTIFFEQNHSEKRYFTVLNRYSDSFSLRGSFIVFL